MFELVKVISKAFKTESTRIKVVSKPIDKASNPNSFAVIPVNGAITLMDQRCGPEGTKTKAQYLADAGINPNIDGVILSLFPLCSGWLNLASS